MAYIRVILNIISRPWNECLCWFPSNVPDHVVKTTGKKVSLPNHVVLTWTVLSKRNGSEFKDNTVQGTKQFGTQKLTFPILYMIYQDFHCHKMCFFSKHYVLSRIFKLDSAKFLKGNKSYIWIDMEAILHQTVCHLCLLSRKY